MSIKTWFANRRMAKLERKRLEGYNCVAGALLRGENPAKLYALSYDSRGRVVPGFALGVRGALRDHWRLRGECKPGGSPEHGCACAAAHSVVSSVSIRAGIKAWLEARRVTKRAQNYLDSYNYVAGELLRGTDPATVTSHTLHSLNNGKYKFNNTSLRDAINAHERLRAKGKQLKRKVPE